MKYKILPLLLILVLALTLISCGNLDKIREPGIPEQMETAQIDQNGEYSKPEEVAEYIHIYSQLPKNYITKKEAISLGWESSKGNLWDVSDNASIGGDVFQNREGRLPKAEGRRWYECDVNYSGGFRGGERLVYSNDGLIFYTKDHYETFTEISFAERRSI